MSRPRVPEDELDFADDTLTYWNGHRFTGIAEERSADGAIETETEYRNGIPDGIARGYWPNGEVRRESWYDYGVRIRQRSWYENGAPQEDVVYDDKGVKHHYTYSEDGSPADSFFRRG